MGLRFYLEASGPVNVAVVWPGLPHYAARQLLHARKTFYDDKITMIGVLPSPHEAEVNQILSDDLTWIEKSDTKRLSQLVTDSMDVVIVGGWNLPISRWLARKAKRSGSLTCVMMDNRWRGDLRQRVGRLYSKFCLRTIFDVIWVPGASGEKLADWLGFDATRRLTGLYGADSSAFPPGAMLPARPKKIVFAGQLIDRKNVAAMVRAFHAFRANNPEWVLDIYGTGPLASSISRGNGITLHGQADSLTIGRAMQTSRFLVLASTDDNWGLVVHEAALSGCGLILTRAIGAGFDLGTSRNCILAHSGSERDLLTAFHAAAALDNTRLAEAGEESLRLAAGFGPAKFVQQFQHLLSMRRLTETKCT